MSISNISGDAYVQGVDPNEIFKKWADKKLHTRGDYVNISDEGRTKAEELAKAKTAAQTGLPDTEDLDEGQTEGMSASAGGKAGASSALNKSAEEEVKDLEAKIKALMDQLMNIMQGPASPEEKMQQAQPIQQQISQLQAQLNELKAQMQKEKAA